MRPRKRALSEEERRLWNEVSRLVTPLLPPRADADQHAAMAVETTDGTEPPETVVRAKVKRPAALPASSVRKVKLGEFQPIPSLPPKSSVVFRPALPEVGLEARERRGLKRGTVPIEARIDLHGLYQAQAHAALVGFIRHACTMGFARVLVVTGKGGETSLLSSERGVLRRSVPHWLRGSELRDLVLGFEEASRRHGGAGALYVRLKRRR